METLNNQYWLYSLLLLWETVWKGIALYSAARAKHKYWFVAFLLLNSFGIIPLVYLVFFNSENFLAKDKLRQKFFPKHAGREK